jgi:NADH-quinone oxidoreductase subunit J
VFAVMLAEPDEPKPKANRSLGLVWTSTLVIVTGVLWWGLIRLAAQAPTPGAVTRVNDGSVEAIGLSLLTSYGMAFELISLVLLVAILGALAIARHGREPP